MMGRAVLLLLCCSYSAYANVGNDLKRFFNAAGMSSNITNPGVYEDQSAGFYTGGSLFARNQVRNQQPLNITMPDYRAGCGGIDIFTGGFSFIKAEQFVEMLKNIGSNAASYSFMLGIKTVAPTIGDVMGTLQSVSQFANNQNVNSCNAAALLAGGLWPRTAAGSDAYCKTLGVESGYFKDYLAASHGCTTGDKKGAVGARKRNTPGFEHVLSDNVNIAWKAIQSNAYLQSQGPEIAQFYMTISGTIIINNKKQALLPSRTTDAIIGAILHGKEVSVYQCKGLASFNNDCLEVDEKVKIVVSRERSLKKVVENMLKGMMDKIKRDEKLEAAEISFLNTTSLPVYRMLNVASAYSKVHPDLQVTKYSEAIALDLLFQYLNEILESMIETITQLQKVQIDDAKLKVFRDGLDEARELVLQKRNQAFQRLQIKLMMIDTVKIKEKEIASQIDISGDLRK